MNHKEYTEAVRKLAHLKCGMNSLNALFHPTKDLDPDFEDAMKKLSRMSYRFVLAIQKYEYHEDDKKFAKCQTCLDCGFVNPSIDGWVPALMTIVECQGLTRFDCPDCNVEEVDYLDKLNMIARMNRKRSEAEVMSQSLDEAKAQITADALFETDVDKEGVDKADCQTCFDLRSLACVCSGGQPCGKCYASGKYDCPDCTTDKEEDKTFMEKMDIDEQT